MYFTDNLLTYYKVDTVTFLCYEMNKNAHKALFKCIYNTIKFNANQKIVNNQS